MVAQQLKSLASKPASLIRAPVSVLAVLFLSHLSADRPRKAAEDASEFGLLHTCVEDFSKALAFLFPIWPSHGHCRKRQNQ